MKNLLTTAVCVFLICASLNAGAAGAVFVASDEEIKELKEPEKTARDPAYPDYLYTDYKPPGPKKDTQETVFVRNNTPAVPEYSKFSSDSIEVEIAEAITNTVARKASENSRKKIAGEGKYLDYENVIGSVKVIHKGRISGLKKYQEECRLIFPGVRPWITRRGRWNGGPVTVGELANALVQLENAGINIERLDIAVSSDKELEKAAEAVTKLGLVDITIAGKSPSGKKFVRAEIQYPYKNNSK